MNEQTPEPQSEQEHADEKSDAWAAVLLVLLAVAAASFWVSGL